MHGTETHANNNNIINYALRRLDIVKPRDGTQIHVQI